MSHVRVFTCSDCRNEYPCVLTTSYGQYHAPENDPPTRCPYSEWEAESNWKEVS